MTTDQHEKIFTIENQTTFNFCVTHDKLRSVWVSHININRVIKKYLFSSNQQKVKFFAWVSQQKSFSSCIIQFLDCSNVFYTSTHDQKYFFLNRWIFFFFFSSLTIIILYKYEFFSSDWICLERKDQTDSSILWSFQLIVMNHSRICEFYQIAITRNTMVQLNYTIFTCHQLTQDWIVSINNFFSIEFTFHSLMKF